MLIILKSHIEERLASFSLNNLQILLLVFMPLLITPYWIIQAIEHYLTESNSYAAFYLKGRSLDEKNIDSSGICQHSLATLVELDA